MFQEEDLMHKQNQNFKTFCRSNYGSEHMLRMFNSNGYTQVETQVLQASKLEIGEGRTSNQEMGGIFCRSNYGFEHMLCMSNSIGFTKVETRVFQASKLEIKEGEDFKPRKMRGGTSQIRCVIKLLI